MRKTNKKAFTLVELLVVVAVIGILFVVLLSKVDFATDKAKATGVQTDFRSFQLAFEAVAKENAGFNTFGWDEGDANGDRIRNNVDAGDLPANGGNGNGVLDNDETAIGRKVYTETWTGTYSLNNPKAGATDEEKISAVKALEAAVNKNLDPKLHITITPVDSDSDGLFDEYNVTMSNQARDPWKNQYHGHFITNASEKSTTNTSLNATPDGKDRGAFVIYSDGANGKDGSVEDIVGGKVIVSVLLADKEASSVAGTTDNNKDGKDDYSVAVVYTYENGYGEVSSSSTGFSNNQGTVNSVLAGNPGAGGGGGGAGGVTPPPVVLSGSAGFDGLDAEGLPCEITLTWEELKDPANGTLYGYDASAITDTAIGERAFLNSTNLLWITIPEGVTRIEASAFSSCYLFCGADLPSTLTYIGKRAFYNNPIGAMSITIPKNVEEIAEEAFACCDGMTVTFEDGSKLNTIGESAFSSCCPLTCDRLPDSVVTIGDYAFNYSGLESIVLGSSVQTIGDNAFRDTWIQQIVIPSGVTKIGESAFYSCFSLNSIHFEGTVAEWNAITKGDYWNESVPATQVTCSDGVVSLD